MNYYRQLSEIATVSGTWVQVKDASSGSAYAAPTPGRAVINSFRVCNHGANAASVDVAVAGASGPSSLDQHAIAPTSVAATTSTHFPDVIVIPAGSSLWFKATGTSPSVTLRAAIMEVV